MTDEDAGEEHGGGAPRGVDFGAVARVSTRVTLQSVSFFTATANRFVEAELVPKDWNKDAFIGFHTRVAELSEESGRLATHASFLALSKAGFELAASGPGGLGDENPDVALEAELELIYEVAGEGAIDPDDAQDFAQANGILHAWPYWREFAQSGSMRLGVEPLVIGVFKLPWSGDPTPVPPQGPSS